MLLFFYCYLRYRIYNCSFYNIHTDSNVFFSVSSNNPSEPNIIIKDTEFNGILNLLKIYI